jgi:hypothetical protein
MPRRKAPRIPDVVLDQLLAGADPKTVFDPNGLLDDLKKALAERVLNAEMDHREDHSQMSHRRQAAGITFFSKGPSTPCCRASHRPAAASVWRSPPPETAAASPR